MFFIWFSVFFCFAFSILWFLLFDGFSFHFQNKMLFISKKITIISVDYCRNIFTCVFAEGLIESLFAFFNINRKPNSKIFPNVIVNVESLNDVFVSNQKYGFCRQTFFSDKHFFSANMFDSWNKEEIPYPILPLASKCFRYFRWFVD